MRIAFFDSISWGYSIDTATTSPLGGTQSGVCHLAAALARQGHDVFLLNAVEKSHVSQGVQVMPIREVFHPVEMSILSLDAIVVINSASNGPVVRQIVGPDLPLLLWTSHVDDQPSVQALKNPLYRDAYDAFVFISNWQRSVYMRRFGVPSHKSLTLPLAISPQFENRFAPGESIVATKDSPPTLAYTSTPFRGLDILLELFPMIQAQVPDVRLKVFSDMSIYKMDAEADHAQFGDLYEACRRTEGVEYIGAVPQPRLAEELKSVSVLAYPNIYPETGCVAAMEAMASGCWVVTTALGALPETTAGFARLVHLQREARAYVEPFVQHVVDVLRQNQEAPETSEQLLRAQVAYAHDALVWDARALQWVEQLRLLQPKRRSAIYAL